MKEQIINSADRHIFNPVRERPQDFNISFSAGSGSGSLPGFTKIGGLVPTGDLMKTEDVAPFCGELLRGIMTIDEVEGINNGEVSFSTHLGVSIDYAHQDFNNQGWTPDKGRDRLRDYKTQFQRLEGDTSKLAVLRRSYLKSRIPIEEKRLEVWRSLSSSDRVLIENPFPIVYGVVDFDSTKEIEAGYTRHLGSDMIEVTHKGKVPFRTLRDGLGRIVVYCPKDKVGELKNYFEGKQIKIAVQPIEPLEHMVKKNLFPSQIIDELQKEDTLEKLLQDPNIFFCLKRAGINDPMNYHYYDENFQLVTRPVTFEEIVEISNQQNPNHFDLDQPPAGDAQKMLEWLRWRNAGNLVYSDNITVPMMAKAIEVIKKLGLPVENLSESQIFLSQDLTDEQIRELIEKYSRPVLDFMTSIINTPGLLAEDEIKAINKQAQSYRLKRRLEDPLFQPQDLFKYREELPSNIGAHYDAHGLARGDELRVLNFLLSHGVSPDHMFYTCPLKSDNEADLASAFGAAGPYTDGAFIVLSEKDGYVRETGIKSVLVNEQFYDAIPKLKSKFPHIRFIKASEMTEVLSKD